MPTNFRKITGTFVAIDDVQDAAGQQGDDGEEDANDDADGRRGDVVVSVIAGSHVDRRRQLLVPDVDTNLICVVDVQVEVGDGTAHAVVVVVLLFDFYVRCFIQL